MIVRTIAAIAIAFVMATQLVLASSAPFPQFYGDTLRLVAQGGLPSGSTVTIAYGPSRRTLAYKPAVSGGGLALIQLPLTATEASATLRAGAMIDIALSGPGATGHWKIEPVLDFVRDSSDPLTFAGGGDTESTGSLTRTADGGRAAMSFTGTKNNYVEFKVDRPLPTDTIVVGALSCSDASVPMGAYFSHRIEDARGEIFGYIGHGDGYDEAVTQSVPLTRIRYRYAAPVDGQKPSPIAPFTLMSLIVEPAKWKFAGPSAAVISCVYTIRQLASDVPDTAPRVSVALDQPTPGNKSMSGFLHGIGPGTPPDTSLAPLRPKLWRVGFDQWIAYRDRVKSLGATTVYVLSDLWGYDAARSPLDHQAEFAAMVKRIAPEGARYDVIWDLWNEPDGTMPWKGADALKFFAVFGDAYRAVKAEAGPNARIEGPSYTHYDYAAIRDFLDYCLAQHIRLDYLSWHELDVDGEVPILADHLRNARREFVDNPKYKPLGINGIHINEIVGSSAQYRPGEIVAYLRALEDGGADAACKGCWYANDGQMNGFNNSLDGIVTPNVGQPRAAWWAYKTYADGTDTRVASKSSDIRVAAIASADATRVQLLIGCHPMQAFGGPSAPTVAFTGLAKSFPGATNVAVEVTRLPDSGEAALAAPLPVLRTTVAVHGDAAEVVLPAIGEHEALIVTVTRG